MSHYIERYCAEHAYWDDDVDHPEEACPKCIAEGKFKTRAMLEARIAALEAALSASETPSAFHPEYTKGFDDGLRRAANMAECAEPNDGRDHTECPFCSIAREIREQVSAATDRRGA